VAGIAEAVGDTQDELPSLVRRESLAQLVPRDSATVHDQRQRTEWLDRLDAADDLVGAAILIVADLPMARLGPGEVSGGPSRCRRAR
jgi:hypothetical protein